MNAVDVVTPLGEVRGQSNGSVDAFKGIRYAEPPIGEHRWQPPRPACPWSGIVEANTLGPGCPQQTFPRRGAGVIGSEDCLRLNLWRPAGTKAGAGLPVMVWLHGGGFVSGSSAPARYDGSGFACGGVVMISLDYRVGRLGFFAHPALADDPLRGNYGLMDQIEALRWVQANVTAFGGNPNDVTLFGESAGGMSVMALLTSRYAEGLFHKAIVQSGGGRRLLVSGNDWASATARTMTLARSLDIAADGSRASLEMLRAIPADQLVVGLDMSNLDMLPGFSAPMIDGVIIEDEPQALLKQGAFHRLPLIIGTTSADLGNVQPVNSFEEALAPFRYYPTQMAQACRLLASFSPQQAARRIATDLMMDEPARFVARTFAAHSVPVWRYRFDYVVEAMSDGLSGAPHGGEIEFVFDTLNTLRVPTTLRDRQVADMMHSYWLAFAKQGAPQFPKLPAWKGQGHDKQFDTLLVVSPNGVIQTRSMLDEAASRLDLATWLAERQL